MFVPKNSYAYQELIDCGHGKLFGHGNARLPVPPMLMFDRITEIYDEGGIYKKGYMRCDLKVSPELWFFNCHFVEDPVMPGCLGLDALWQMVGFFLGWKGHPGRGRALGVGHVKFTGQIMPDNGNVEYGIDIKRVMNSKLVLGIADGWVKVDGEIIYTAEDLRVGLFRL